MRRLLATLLTTSLLVTLAGCGRTYEERVRLTLAQMEYRQRLDRNLQPPISDPFQQLGIYLRPPQPLTRAQQPGLTADPEEFDAIATFLDVSGDATKPDGAPAVLRLHVLARSKQAPAPAPAREGEEPPPPIERLDFQQAVYEALANDLGGIDPNEVQSLSTEKLRSNEFRRLSFTAANDNMVRAYFFRQGDHEVALIWDYPQSLENAPIITAGRTLTLESLAVGPKAAAAFQGVDVDEEGFIPGAPGEPGAAAVPGQVF